MPKITYIMAAYNAAPWIEAAISSALGQTGVEIEVVVVDDASSDETPAIVAALATDPRVVFIRRDTGGGPAAARNMALARATGDWIGILDADDLIEPQRSTALLALAEREQCDIVADNLLSFEDGNPSKVKPLLSGQAIAAKPRLNVADYLDRNLMTGGDTNLGFLKPIFRRERMARYDERLRIGEDFDLVLRCMISGSDLVLDPEPMYHYRVRSGSLTRQLVPSDIAMMLAVHENAFTRPLTPAEHHADKRFRHAMYGMLAYVTCRTDLRRRAWLTAGRHALRPVFWGAAVPVLRRAVSRRLDRTAPR